MATNPHAQIVDDIKIVSFGSEDEQDETEVDLNGHSGIVRGDDAPPPLHNATSTRNGMVKKESPRARQAAYFISEGKTHEQTSQLTGLSRPHISLLVQQRWFQDLVTHFLHEAGADPLRKLFQSAAVDSYWKLIELRDSPATPPNVKEKIANGMIDRVVGRAPVHIVSKDNAVSEDPRREADSLYEQLEKVDAQRRAALAREEATKTTKPTNDTTTPTGPDFSKVD